MIKEIKYGGVTTTPSDYDCNDGDLASSSGIVKEEGKVLVTKEPDNAIVVDSVPVVFTNKPLVKHVTVDGTVNWICYGDKTIDNVVRHCLFAGMSSDNIANLYLAGEPKSVQTIGNTLIVVDSDGTLHYVAYKNGEYKYLGDHIPQLNLQFGLYGSLEMKEQGVSSFNTHRYESDQSHYVISSSDVDSVTKSVYGAVELLRQDDDNKDKFCYPFFVRYALRLYDGSYANISAPIFMDCGRFVPLVMYTLDRSQYEQAHTTIYAFLEFCKLQAKMLNDNTDFDGWEDVISGVDVFVSSQFEQFDMLESLDADTYNYTNGASVIGKSNYCMTYNGVDYGFIRFGMAAVAQAKDAAGISGAGTDADVFAFTLPCTTREEDIKNNGTFYLLHSFGFRTNISHYVPDGITSSFTDIPVKKGTLSVIETQKVLPDDYYSADKLSAVTAFVYNSKLMIGNVTRQLFEGFSPIELNPPFKGNPTYNSITTNRDVKFEVYLKESGINQKVEAVGTINADQFESMYYGYAPQYFFYPNPNAYAVRITIDYNGGSALYLYYELQAHPMLNGSYYYDRDGVSGFLPSKPPMPGDEGQPSVVDYVQYPNQIYSSKVYNPYVFEASGVNEIGGGAEIKMLASNTQALSQGQFGQFPLYVFTSLGIWALELSKAGEFTSLSPVTRDIILGGGESLIQLDDSLLFATKQGIMELVGKNTKCISTSLDEKSALPTLANISLVTGSAPQDTDFRSFIDGCRMVYDYVNARVVVFKEGVSNAYIYSAKDQAWTLIPLVGLIDTINSYPDAYAVMEKTENNTTTYSIVDIATITDEQTAQAGQPTPTNEGWFITRPISLDADNNFKFIDTIRQNGVFEEYMVKENGEYKGYNAVASRNNPEIGDPVYAETGAHEVVRQVLYGSNDLINWFVCGSSRSRYITELKGAQFKWYRLAVRTKFKYGESLSSVTFSYRIKAENPHLF